MPDLAVPVDDVLIRGQLVQANGAARVQTVRADPNLRAEAELIAIREASAGIDEDGRRINAPGEFIGRAQTVRDDGVRMAAAVRPTARLLEENRKGVSRCHEARPTGSTHAPFGADGGRQPGFQMARNDAGPLTLL